MIQLLVCIVLILSTVPDGMSAAEREDARMQAYLEKLRAGQLTRPGLVVEDVLLVEGH